MAAVDHRIVTIPLFIGGAVALAAGLVGALVAATTDIEVSNPLGMAGVGLVALVAASAVSLALHRAAPDAREVVPIPIEPRARKNRIVAGGLALAMVVLVALAVAGPGASVAGYVREMTGADAPIDAAGTVDALDAAAPLDTQEIAFDQLGGATVAGVALGGTGTPDQPHDLDAPAQTTAYLLELQWEAGAGQSETLRLMIEAEVDGAWQVVSEATGGSVLRVSADEIPDGATDVRAHVALPDNTPSDFISYTLRAAYFEGPVPDDYTLFEG